jgi:hypothetical protein
VNIISSSGEPTRVGPTAWGLGEEFLTLKKKEKSITKCYTGPRNWTDSLERPRQRKMEGRDHLEEVGVDGNIILEWILGK